jgi:hypothetical protein
MTACRHSTGREHLVKGFEAAIALRPVGVQRAGKSIGDPVPGSPAGGFTEPVDRSTRRQCDVDSRRPVADSAVQGEANQPLLVLSLLSFLSL